MRRPAATHPARPDVPVLPHLRDSKHSGRGDRSLGNHRSPTIRGARGAPAPDRARRRPARGHGRRVRRDGAPEARSRARSPRPRSTGCSRPCATASGTRRRSRSGCARPTASTCRSSTATATSSARSSSRAASPRGASRRAGTGATTPATSSRKARTGRASISAGSAARSCSRTRSRSTSRRPSPSWFGRPAVFSPDGDGRSDKVTVRYRMSEPGERAPPRRRRAARTARGSRRSRESSTGSGSSTASRCPAGRTSCRSMGATAPATARSRPRRRESASATIELAARARPRAAARPVRDRRRHGRGVVPLALRRRQRHRQRAAPRAPRPGPAGPLHALRRGERARRPRHGARPCTLSSRRSAGSSAPPGSRSSSSRRRGRVRLVGLVAWAAGGAALAACARAGRARRPDRRGRRGRGGGRGRPAPCCSSAGRGSCRVADARLRPGPHPGRARRRGGEPAAAAVRASSRGAASRSAGSSCAATGARASSARSPGRSRPRRLVGALARSGRPTCARARSTSVASCSRSRCSRSRSRRLPVERARWLAFLFAQLVGDGPRVRRVGIYQWVHARRLLEPEGDRRQRVRAVLPRQLALLGSVDLRALPRRRDPRLPRRRALRGPARERRRSRRRVIAVLWVGLVFSFSQSSFVALVAGVARRGGARRGGRRALVPLAARRRLRRARRFSAPQRARRAPGRRSTGATSGRSSLVGNGVGSRATTRSSASGIGGFQRRTRNGLDLPRRATPSAPPRTRRRSRWRPRAGSRGCCSRLARSLAGARRRRSAAPRELRRTRSAWRRPGAGGDRRAQPVLQRVLRGPDDVGPPRPSPSRSRAGAGRRQVIEGWRRVLVLAPHTDDGEFGCGGTMARLVEARRRGALRRLLDRDEVAPGGFPAGHARARGARGDRRDRHPGGAASTCTTSRSARSPSTARRSSSC